MGFTKAVKSQAKLKMAITGTSGSGKTYTALRVARGIGQRIALIDSEHKSASKYADLFEFDTLDISANTHPNEYVKAIEMARVEGYDVLIIDSLTHAWDATKKEVDRLSQASRSGNSYVQWAQGTKIWDGLKAAINKAPLHIIVTMRSKTDYVQEDNNGKKQIRKVGLAPEVRDGTEYEYDIVLDMTNEHFGSISKTRCASLDGYAQEKPGEDLGESLKEWLSDGVEAPAEPEPQATTAPRQYTEEEKQANFAKACAPEIERIGPEKWATFLGAWRIAELVDLDPASRQNFLKQLKEMK
jgi:hypothetical protein